jgi:hypothetical protein
MTQVLQQMVATLMGMLFALQGTVAGVPAKTQVAQVGGVTPTATLTLSPTSNSVSINSTFAVNIVLNTGGQNAYGADINKIHFNPSFLQVVDSDSVTAGVQIAAGALMPMTIINSVDNTGGSVQFSQLATPGSTYSGSGTLATITFRAASAGTSNVTFDFTSGSGTDSNVAGLGGDLLLSVGSGSYTGVALDTTAPTAPGTPSLSVISSSQINLSWTASTDAVGVTGYKVERCSGSATCSTYSQISAPVTNSYSDTGLSASTIYRYRVRANDAAGNNSSYSSAANATTQAPPDTTPPTISGVTASGITTAGATITWTTNESADTQVDYGPTVSYGNSTALNSSMVTSHSAALSGLSAGTLYHYRVKSKDVAGNSTLSSDNTFTTSALPISVQRKIILVPEGAPAGKMNVSGIVEFLNPIDGSKVSQANFTTDSSGQYVMDISAGALPATVNFHSIVLGYLSKISSGVDLRNTTSVLNVNFPTLPAGDFNGDQLINSLDFSFMNDNWNVANNLADVNKDGVVNSLDFAYVSNNWLSSGE